MPARFWLDTSFVGSSLVRAQVAGTLEGLLFLLLAIVAFSLTRFDRSDPVYVWMGSVFLLLAANAVLSCYRAWTQYLNVIADLVLQDGIIRRFCSAPGSWCGGSGSGCTGLRGCLGRSRLLTLGFMVSTVIGENLLYPLISLPVADIFHTVSIAVRLALLMVLILVVIWGIRRQGAEGWLVLPAVVLLIVSLFTAELLCCI